MVGGVVGENRQTMPEQAAAEGGDSVDQHIAKAVGSGGMQALEQFIMYTV